MHVTGETKPKGYPIGPICIDEAFLMMASSARKSNYNHARVIGSRLINGLVTSITPVSGLWLVE
jgi:hypothetical protein